MNRLINQYGAFNTPLGEKAMDLVMDFEKNVRVFIQLNDLNPAEIRVLSVIANADCTCAEMVLISAIKMKKSEKINFSA